MSARDDGWHVGSTVFVHETGHRQKTYTAAVTKVGRKWVEFQIDGSGWRGKEHRFDCETMLLDGGNMGWRGKVYLSEADYVQECETEKAWTSFVRRLPNRAPSHVTVASIARLEALIWPGPVS